MFVPKDFTKIVIKFLLFCIKNCFFEGYTTRIIAFFAKNIGSIHRYGLPRGPMECLLCRAGIFSHFGPTGNASTQSSNRQPSATWQAKTRATTISGGVAPIILIVNALQKIVCVNYAPDFLQTADTQNIRCHGKKSRRRRCRRCRT